MIIRPEVSVILSTYNRHRPGLQCDSLLERALKSILNQSFFDFELILIDDASTDDTERVCRKYAAQDFRIKYVRHDQNSALPARRYNEGISLSCARLIAFMFDDDEWLPHALQDLYNFFKLNLSVHKNLGLVYGQADLFSPIDTNNRLAFGEPWDIKNIMHHNLIANCAVMVRRDAIDVVGAYDESPLLRRHCDWDLWIRLGKKYEIMRLEKVIAHVYMDQVDSIGIRFTFNERAIFLYKIFRRSYPLKTKRMGFRQFFHYFLMLWNLYNPFPALYNVISTQCTLANLKIIIKKTLIYIGGWRLAKSLYDRLKT